MFQTLASMPSAHTEFIDSVINLQKRWWVVALRGLIGVGLGLVAIFFPLATMLSLVVVFGSYLLIDGIFAFFAASTIKGPSKARTWLISEGVINIIVGILILVWPELSLIAMVFLTAGWAILTGFFMIAAGFTGARDRADWWFILGGLVSLIYGIVLSIAPILGAIVMTWWLGAYALAFGFVLLTLAADLLASKRQGN